MNRCWMTSALISMLALSLLSGRVSADEGTWVTDAAVGVNEVLYTLELTCANTGFVCDLIDGYSDQDASVATGSGTLELDDALDEFQFDTDSMQDVGAGLQDAYTTLSGTDLTFANIPFAGVPQITNNLVFALTNPLISVPGLDLLTPGDYPFSESINYSGTGLVIGDLEFLLGPDIVVPPGNIVVSGTFRALGDVGSNGTIDYEIRDLTGTFTFQNLTTIGGEPVTVDVTADVTLNLSGASGTPTIPALNSLGLSILFATLVATASRARKVA